MLILDRWLTALLLVLGWGFVWFSGFVVCGCCVGACGSCSLGVRRLTIGLGDVVCFDLV